MLYLHFNSAVVLPCLLTWNCHHPLCKPRIQKRINRKLIGKFCLRDWPLAGIWGLSSQIVPYTDLKLSLNDSGSLCWNCLYMTMWFILSACFPSVSLKFWQMLGRGYLGDQLPVKSLRESLMSFPSRQHLSTLSHLIARGFELILCESTGRGSLEACSWFPLSSLPFSSPLLILLYILSL